ncbi:MAG: purine-nucleoside phosphorylase [Deltaproteobacteria bacterium]|jgi:purine-nucleoside phosphorylase|nr:purine-nucleoside phosphorylase [Deltaproteobacteria bacterium]
MQNPEEVQRAAMYISEHAPGAFRPELALVCGTGFGKLADMFRCVRSIPFENSPGFPRATVASHAGSFAAAYFGEKAVLLQQGRCHLYEGYSPAQVCMGVRVAYTLGARSLVIANAAGSLNPQWSAGDVMLITDHLNCTGTSPLVGPNHDPWGPRFPDMSRLYDREYQRLALDAARTSGVRLERGVYAGVLGPELENPAQTRMYRQAGADAIGMSTVLEVIAARHLGMRVLAFSCLSNANLPDCMEETSLEEIIATVRASSETVIRLLGVLLPRILHEDSA